MQVILDESGFFIDEKAPDLHQRLLTTNSNQMKTSQFNNKITPDNVNSLFL
jgi:hypothetical protein